MISRSAFPGLCAPGGERWRVSEIFKPATFDSECYIFYRTNCVRVIISHACNLSAVTAVCRWPVWREENRPLSRAGFCHHHHHRPPTPAARVIGRWWWRPASSLTSRSEVGFLRAGRRGGCVKEDTEQILFICFGLLKSHAIGVTFCICFGAIYWSCRLNVCFRYSSTWTMRLIQVTCLIYVDYILHPDEIFC